MFEKSGVPEDLLEPKNNEVIVLPFQSAQTPPLSESDLTLTTGSVRYSLEKAGVEGNSEYESAMRMRERLSRNHIVLHKIERTVPGRE